MSSTSSNKIRWIKPLVFWNILLNTGEYKDTLVFHWSDEIVTIRSHNPLLSTSNESYSVLGERKSYKTSNFINAARTEDGTTFYMRQTFHN